MKSHTHRYLLVTLALLAPLVASAFVVNKTHSREIKWPVRNVSFLINPDSGPAGASAAIQAGMTTWSTVPGANFHLTSAGATSRTGDTRDDHNVCSFGDLGADGTIAQSSFWFNPNTGVLGESDIVFNTHYLWSASGAPGRYDVQNVATHELGHSLSLDDLSGPSHSEKTMYGYTAPGETKKRSLEADDIAGICHLYPAGPTLPASGNSVFRGLFHDPTNLLQQSSGALTLTASKRGTFSGKLSLAGRAYPFRGTFDSSGTAGVTVSRAHNSSLTLQLRLQDEDVLVGTVGDGNWLAAVHADRAVFSRDNPCGYAGLYTFTIPGSTNAPSFPGGDSYWTVTIKSGGGLTLVGSLADGTKISQSTALAKDGRQPLFVPLYKGGGFIIGWINFSPGAINTPGSDVVWIKPTLAGNGAPYYPSGFSERMVVYGWNYVPPTKQESVFNFTNGVVLMQGGNLPDSVQLPITLLPDNKVAGPAQPKLRLTLGTARGTFSGSFTLPSSRQTYKLNGVLLRQMNSASGYFLGTDQSGLVRIGAAPQ